MLKLAVAAAIFALGIAGTASAAGWRSLRLDARDEASFTSSVAVFEKKLSPEQWYVFRVALHDIWDHGTKNAAADEREYTAADYLRQLDGLRYEEIVRFTDPTGQTARRNEAIYDIWFADLTVPRIPNRGQVPGARYGQQQYQQVGYRGEQLHGSPAVADHRP